MKPMHRRDLYWWNILEVGDVVRDRREQGEIEGRVVKAGELGPLVEWANGETFRMLPDSDFQPMQIFPGPIVRDLVGADVLTAEIRAAC